MARWLTCLSLCWYSRRVVNVVSIEDSPSTSLPDGDLRKSLPGDAAPFRLLPASATLPGTIEMRAQSLPDHRDGTIYIFIDGPATDTIFWYAFSLAQTDRQAVRPKPGSYICHLPYQSLPTQDSFHPDRGSFTNKQL